MSRRARRPGWYLPPRTPYQGVDTGRLTPTWDCRSSKGASSAWSTARFSKAFRGELHPVEIGRRVTREMDLKRRLGVHGLIAPNAFVVHLSPSDFDRFESFLDALVRELEEAAREHARTEEYVFVGPVTVSVVEDPRQRRGRFDRGVRRPRGPGGPHRRLGRPGRRHAGGARAPSPSPSAGCPRAPSSSTTRTPAGATPRSGAPATTWSWST